MSQIASVPLHKPGVAERRRLKVRRGEKKKKKRRDERDR